MARHRFEAQLDTASVCLKKKRAQYTDLIIGTPAFPYIVRLFHSMGFVSVYYRDLFPKVSLSSLNPRYYN